MSRTFVVHYSELALKGKNRPEFVRALRRNIAKSLSAHKPEIRLKDGRFLVTLGAEPDDPGQRLSKVFGIAWFAEASSVEPDYQSIRESVLEHSTSDPSPTFKIEPRRSDKTFGISSHELAVRLGSEVVSRTGKRVDLSNPGLTLHVDVVRGEALVYAKRSNGPGGLPVGTAGRVVHLFSGGIDSPVAAWLLMKRGCRPVYLHFFLAPNLEPVMNSKITRLIRILSAYSGKSTAILVPFDEYQLATFGVPAALEPTLFRRFMRVTAEEIAPRFRAFGISTGDSLSQAASQTLWNIGAFDEGSSLPILRPLLSYDKEEIVTLAKKIGTYEPSLEEYKDCCSIVSRHPRTRVRASLVSKFSEELGFRDLARKSLDRSTLISYNPQPDETRVRPLSELLLAQPVQASTNE